MLLLIWENSGVITEITIRGKTVFFPAKCSYSWGYSSEWNKQFLIVTFTVYLHKWVLHQESQESGRAPCCVDQHRHRGLHGDLMHLNTHSQTWQVEFSQGAPTNGICQWMYVNALWSVVFGIASTHQSGIICTREGTSPCRRRVTQSDSCCAHTASSQAARQRKDTAF